MALAEFAATVTVTVYVAVVPFAAVTTYALEVVKLFDVSPLTCVTAGVPIFTAAPVVVNAATSVVTSVPNGTVTAMVFAASFIVPILGPPVIGADGVPTLVNEYAVMALVEAGAGARLSLPPPPPHPAIKKTPSIKVNKR